MLLIILAGYEFYILNNRLQNDYQHTLSSMRTYDIERSEEDLRFTYIYLNQDNKFTLKIRNDGPEVVGTKYVGVFLEGDPNEDPYKPINAYIVPTEVIDIYVDYEVDPEEEYIIQVVTEKGNIFSLSYPQETIDYPYHYIVADAISEVIGRVIPTYESFRWAVRARTQDSGFDWKSTWSIASPPPGQYAHIFKLDVVYYGKTSIVLGKNTAFYTIRLDVSSSSPPFYLVHYNEATGKISAYSEATNNIVLPAFDPDNPQPVTLHFGVLKREGNPLSNNDIGSLGSGTYMINFAVYERPGDGDYSQGFSLIAVEVN